MKKHLILTLLLPVIASNSTFCFEYESPKGINRKVVPENLETSHQMFVPIPLLFLGGAALLAVKKGAQITKAVIRNPFVAGGIGVLVVAPALKRTLFAKNPETNPQAMAESIREEWRTDFAQATENIDKAGEDFKTNHPIMYKKLKKMHDAPEMQKLLNKMRENAHDFNQWRIEQIDIITHWFDEEDEQTDVSQTPAPEETANPIVSEPVMTESVESKKTE